MEKTFQTSGSKVPPSEVTDPAKETGEGYERSSREAYTLHLADTTLILSHRNSEWCGHGPVLEQDIAITNISLDLLGQSRYFYQYAAILIGGGASEDSLAYLRKEREFKNLLLVEQPNGDWARTILRQYLFSQFQYLLFEQLQQCNDSQLSAIAAKSIKETAYHLRWSREWVIRLGDGTAESHNRLLNAMDELWRYTGEMFIPVPYEKEMNMDFTKIKDEWDAKVNTVFNEASLIYPGGFRGIAKGTNEVPGAMQRGGKEGIHTEHLGYILTELQYMQRAYPDSKW